MPGEINVIPTLAPFHYAGMVSNPSTTSLSIQPQKILIIGAHETGVTAVGVKEVTNKDEIKKLYKDISDSDDTESTIVQMLNAAFEANPVTPKYAIAVTDNVPGKAKWVYTFDFANEPDASGDIVLGVCGSDPIKVEFDLEEFKDPQADPLADPPVPPMSEADLKKFRLQVVTGKLKEAIDASQEIEYRVSVDTSGSAMTLESPDFSHMINNMAVGIKINLHQLTEVSSFTPGVAAIGNIDDVIAALPPDIQFTQIASGFNEPEDLRKLDDELIDRWGNIRQIDGHLFVAASGSVSDVKTRYIKDKAKLYNVSIMATSDSVTEPAVWAATLAAVNAAYAHKPYLPYQSLPLGKMVRSPATQFDLAERGLLLDAGISTHRIVGDKVQIDRIVTYYTDDKAYRDLNKKQILSYLRYDFVKFLKQMYPRHALSNDETQSDGDVATPMSARDLVIARHNQWKNKKFVQDPDKKFKKLVWAKIDEESNDTLRFYLPVLLMGQLRRTVTTIAYTP